MKHLKMLFSVALFFSFVLSCLSFAELSPTYAIVDCTIFPVKGTQIENGVIIIRNGLIEAVGPKTKISIPEEAEIIKAEGLNAYPGLIDAHSKLLLVSPKPEPQTQRQNSSSRPGDNPGWQKADFMAFDHLVPKKNTLEGLRKIGITTACLAPDKNIFAGQSVIVNLNSDKKNQMILGNPFGLHINFVTSRGEYPSSLMGTMSVLRQSFLDVEHYFFHKTQYDKSPLGLKRPEFNPFFETLIPYVVNKKPVVFNCENLEDIKRALRLADEFKLKAYISGANEAWRVAGFLKKNQAPLLVSLKFTPPFTSKYINLGEELKKKAEEEIYPANAFNLYKEGIPFSLTSNGLSKPADILKNAKKAIKAGLPKNEALKAMTIHPAVSLGIDDILGTLEKGKIANIVLTSGEIFDEKSQVRNVFVDGIFFEIKQPTKDSKATAVQTNISGKWQAEFVSVMGTMESTIEFKQDGNQVSGNIATEMGKWEIENGVLSGKDLTFTITAIITGESINLDFSGTAEADHIEGSLSFMQGSAQLRATRIPESRY
jgi:imidazolonepropionase-like amidohydrolase